MKKFLSIILVVFMVFLGAAGCASPRASEPSFSQVPTENEELFITELPDNESGSYQMNNASKATAEISENRNGFLLYVIASIWLLALIICLIAGKIIEYRYKMQRIRCETCDHYNSYEFEAECCRCENCNKYQHILIEKDEGEE